MWTNCQKFTIWWKLDQWNGFTSSISSFLLDITIFWNDSNHHYGLLGMSGLLESKEKTTSLPSSMTFHSPLYVPTTATDSDGWISQHWSDLSKILKFNIKIWTLFFAFLNKNRRFKWNYFVQTGLWYSESQSIHRPSKPAVINWLFNVLCVDIPHSES